MLAVYSLQSIINGQGEPLTPEKLKESYYETASFLMSITEDYDEELYAALIDPATQQQRISDYVDDNRGFLPPIDPIDGDEGTFLTNLYNWSINKINTVLNEYNAGNYVKGSADIIKGTGGVYIGGSIMIDKLWPK